jgi:predicted enzyme related to lactoylglutathione lyase
MLLNNASYTSLAAEDIGRAKKFYQEVLGLKLLNDQDGSLLFEAGNATKIFIYQREKTKAEQTVLGFFVEDVEVTAKQLQEKGVKLEHYEGMTNENGIGENNGLKIAWFKDTEGNILCINNPFILDA